MIDLNNTPLYIIMIPIFAAILSYFFEKRGAFTVCFLAQTALTIKVTEYFLCFKKHTCQLVTIGDWNVGIGISLKADSLTLSFLILTLLIWWAILIYAFYEHRNNVYFFFLMFLEGCFIGLLFSYDLFNIYVLIEVITVISTIMITFKKDPKALKSGFYYLIFNNAGMLFFIIGMIILYVVYGSLSLEYMRVNSHLFKDLYPVRLAYALIIVSFGVKSAFFPVYNWLPKAHGSAPSAISALLSGLLVKAGLYAFLRLNSVFNYADYNTIFFYLGFFTAALGAMFAISQTDIKLLLAFSTVSQIGTIFMGISYLDGYSYSGGILHIINHGLFKSLLFLSAGIVAREYSNRNLLQIRGVMRRLPLTGVLMIIGILAMTGAPFLNGFVSKSMISYGIKTSPLRLFLFRGANIMTIIAFLKFSQILFWNDKDSNVSIKPSLKLKRNLAGIFLSTLIVSLGIFHRKMTSYLFSVDTKVVDYFSLPKHIEYMTSLLIAFALYKLFIEREHGLIRKLRSFDLSFENSCYMLLVFTFITTIFLI